MGVGGARGLLLGFVAHVKILENGAKMAHGLRHVTHALRGVPVFMGENFFEANGRNKGEFYRHIGIYLCYAANVTSACMEGRCSPSKVRQSVN